MAGNNSTVGLETITFTDNMSFDGTERGGAMTTNGQLWIGSTAPRHVKLGSLTSPNASIVIGYASPNITLQAASTIATSYVEDSGVATPLLNILNVLGLSGSKTEGSGNTITIKSPPYAAFPATSTATINSGSFITAGGNIILNLPVTAADGDLVEVVCTTANLVAVDAPVNNFIRIGSLITSGGGTATSTLIGDSLSLRYRLADLTWYATSVIGTWVMA